MDDMGTFFGKSSSHILVTGGAGYIGSHTCKTLARAGYTPITYDNLVYGHRWAAKWGPLEVGDLTDRQRLDAVIKKYNPESVIHFAAYAYVGESIKKNWVSTTACYLRKLDNIDRPIFIEFVITLYIYYD